MSLWIKSFTDSLNVMVTEIGDVRVGFEATDESATVGAVVSMTRLFPPPKEDALARAGNVKVALTLLALVMVAPLRVKAVVERYCRSEEV